MIRRMLVASSSDLQFKNRRKVTKKNVDSYRLFLEREILRGLLPNEKYIVHQSLELDSYCALGDDDTYLIQYSTKWVDEFDVFQNLNLEMGFLIHECGHAIFTEYDFKDPSFFEEQSKAFDIPTEYVKAVENILEDVHIENRITNEILGTGPYIYFTREYMTTRMENDLDRFKDGVGLASLYYLAWNREDLCHILLDDPEINKFGYTWETDLKPYIIIPKSSKEVRELTIEVLRRIKKEDKEEMRSNEEFEQALRDLMNALGKALTESQMNDDREQQNASSEKQGRQSESADQKYEETRKRNRWDRDPDKPKSDDEMKTKNGRKPIPFKIKVNRNDDSASSYQVKSGDSPTNSNKDVRPISQVVEKIENHNEESVISEYMPDDMTESQMGTNEVMEGIMDQRVKWVLQKAEDGSKEVYEQIAAHVAPEAAILRSIFEKYNVGGWKVHSQLERGKIDRRFLHRVPLDDQRVFKMMEKKTNSPLDVIVLIDESGSMGGNKCQKAREVAILIHEALLKIPDINYWCYGHTTGYWDTGDSVLMTVYHEGPVTDRNDKYRLAMVKAYSGNCDGRAILEAASRVRNRIKRDRRVLMILISDGLPSESCEGLSAPEFAKRAAIEVEGFGYDFIHVGIECSNHTLYKHSIDYVNNSQLTSVIGQIITNHITRNRAKT